MFEESGKNIYDIIAHSHIYRAGNFWNCPRIYIYTTCMHHAASSTSGLIHIAIAYYSPRMLLIKAEKNSDIGK
jgi:hypothetical protein